MYDEISFFTAFMIGILGSFHCLCMCGVFSTVFFFNIVKDKKKKFIYYHFIYNLGRIFTYCLIGCFFGILGFFFNSFFGKISIFFFKFFSGLSLVLYFFYINKFFSYFFLYFEKIGILFWKKLVLFSKIIDLYTNLVIKTFFLGMIWGFLPCGLVYTAVLYSSSSFSFFNNFFLMLFFGLGTFPSMLFSYFLSKKYFFVLKKYNFIFKFFEFFLFFFGIYIIIDSFLFYGKC